jgi:hypothetical protein
VREKITIKERKIMTIESIQEWLDKSVEGDNITYYKGFLAKDVGGLDYQIKKLGSFMSKIENLKEVNLVQKKISGIKVIGETGPIVYHYIAQRRKNGQPSKA